MLGRRSSYRRAGLHPHRGRECKPAELGEHQQPAQGQTSQQHDSTALHIATHYHYSTACAKVAPFAWVVVTAKDLLAQGMIAPTQFLRRQH
jgi:hypothetical protein